MAAHDGDTGVETLTAEEFIVREVMEEVEAAVALNRCCSYSSCVPAFATLGAVGIAQQIYSCKTCLEICGEFVGVCEPCALRCHEDHELIDVGTRRLFRCDCPTARSGVSCVAQPPSVARAAPPTPAAVSPSAGELPINSTNRYGHNFEGHYCICNRAYQADRDEMLQCIACDDWFHFVHVAGALPQSFSFAAFVCKLCVGKLPFLGPFSAYAPATCSVPAVAAKEGADNFSLQPWVVCLTCTEGADDGRGVCLACAEHCHAGHVLGKARITEFSCDCAELHGKCALVPKALSPVSVSKSCSDTGIVSPLLVSGAPSSAPVDNAAHNGSHGGSTAASPGLSESARPAPLWCAASQAGAAACGVVEAALLTPDSASKTAAAPMFLADESELLDRLCRCGACMRCYAAHGVVAWFFEAPEPVQADQRGTVAATAGSAGSGGPPAGAAAHHGSTGSAMVNALIASLTARAQAESAASGSSASTAAEGTSAAGGGGDAGGLLDHGSAAARLVANAPSLPPGFKTTFEQGMQAVAALPLPQQLDALHGYNEMSTAFLAWLRSVSARQSVVTAADVKTFFDGLQDERRTRRKYNE